ncbi:MAG: DUF4388 domain-containing protein [Polyangiaceae bacterium]
MSVYPPDLDPSEQQGDTPPTIFVSDPSAEADRLSAALHGEGYSVIDGPLSLLVARVAVQTPSLILLDIDAEGALDIVARLRELPGAQGIDVLFLGDAGRTLSDSADALRHEGSGFLARPVDVQALLRKIASLVGAKRDGDDPASSGSSMRPNSEHRSLPPPIRSGRSPLPQTWSDGAAALAGADDALEPSYGAPASGPPRLPLPALSSEIERLLQRAEERSGQDVGPGSLIPAVEPPSPDQEVDAVLPSEVLAALDEPLDEMDDDLESDSGLGTSVPRRVMGTPEVVTSSGHPPSPSDSDEHGAPASQPTPHEAPRQAPPPAPLHAAPPPPPPPAPAKVEQRASRAPSSPPLRGNGDPKEIETPRPPRRATSGPPLGVPSAPAPPRATRSSTMPPSAHGSTNAGPPTIPPVSPRRLRPLMAGAPPLPSLSSSQSITPTDSPPAIARSLGPTPLPPRRSDPSPPPGRRSNDLAQSPEIDADAPAGVAPAELPSELGLGDALTAFAICVRERATGALVIDAPEGVRRILLRDGDVVTAASGLDDESLVGFLGTRGDISQDVASHLNGKVPAYGRHAGAALVANGHLSQDQLWPVLRAHAEWILSCAVLAEKGAASFEVNPPGRLRAEPSVFGGATGAEVLIEVVRRSIPAAAALPRLGGGGARLAEGARYELLSECALSETDQRWLARAKGATLDEALSGVELDELVPTLYALVQLAVIAMEMPGMKAAPPPKKKRAVTRDRFDAIDAQAMRSQVKARLSLVEEGDYFSLLGVPRSATAYEIHRAYLELRRGFEPSRVLNAATADLADDLELIIEVLDEAHDVLRDQSRRERYRRAIEDKPPM